MKKKLMMMVGTATLLFSMGTTVFAASPSKYVTTPQAWAYEQGYDYGFMCDEDGNFLSRTDFVAKLDKATKDGSIQTKDKDAYLKMYDSCNSYMYGNSRRSSGRSCCR